MDAIDNQMEVESAFGSYGDAMAEEATANRWVRVDSGKMTQSVTDDMLLNWPDGFTAHAPPTVAPAPVPNSTSNISSLPTSCPPITPQRPQRKRCGPSNSSDYSSFDFVESSNPTTCLGGQACAGCDRLLKELPVSCSSCHRNYCRGCEDTPQVLNASCKLICGVCRRLNLPEAKEMSASYECAFSNRNSYSSTHGHAITSGFVCSHACATKGSCRHLDRRFPSGSSLACSSTHSQNGTAKA
ncbi:hypothetical protein Aperf_G00000068662 [Anoplocephala perfoliata]